MHFFRCWTYPKICIWVSWYRKSFSCLQSENIHICIHPLFVLYPRKFHNGTPCFCLPGSLVILQFHDHFHSAKRDQILWFHEIICNSGYSIIRRFCPSSSDKENRISRFVFSDKSSSRLQFFALKQVHNPQWCIAEIMFKLLLSFSVYFFQKWQNPRKPIDIIAQTMPMTTEQMSE